MGSISPPSQPLQICLQASRKAGENVPATSASRDDRLSDQHAYHSALLNCTRAAHAFPYSLNFICPHPVLISSAFLAELEHFHVAFSRALTNIVHRWYADKEADFPSRMPLESHEEKLLQWINQCGEEYLLPTYEGHQGSWRPDLLFPLNEAEGFKVCEINARFANNGINMAAWMYTSLEQQETKPQWLDIPANPGQILDRYFDLFNPAVPIHYLQARKDTHLVESFMDLAEERTGLRPRIVGLGDLRLVPDTTSPTGYTLYCTRGSEPRSSTDERNAGLERIHQVRLQLFLDELASLSPEIQQHLALCSAQDIRSILLIHDKRILGILLQELDSLVTKHRVLTKEQADLLQKRVVPTILPGSKELQQLRNLYYQGNLSKNEYIIKPVRSSRGEGIKYGEDLTVSEWEAILTDLHEPGFSAERTLYVVQPLIEQAGTDIFLDEEMKMQRCKLVGSYFSVHGDFTALGPWRTNPSNDKNTNLATGRAWNLGSLVMKKD